MNYTVFSIAFFFSYVSCFADFQKRSSNKALPSTSPVVVHSLQITNSTCSNASGANGYGKLVNTGLTTLCNYGLMKSLYSIKQHFPAITPGLSMIIFAQSVVVGFFDYGFVRLVQEQFPHLGKKAYLALVPPTAFALFLASLRKENQTHVLKHVVTQKQMSTSSFV